MDKTAHHSCCRRGVCALSRAGSPSVRAAARPRVAGRRGKTAPRRARALRARARRARAPRARTLRGRACAPRAPCRPLCYSGSPNYDKLRNEHY